MENLNLTLIQTSLNWEDRKANLDKFSKKIEEVDPDTDLILLQEMFTTGFSMKPQGLAENPEDETLEWMQKHARKKNAAISGSIIVKENENYYNRLYFVFPNGDYDVYDKRHLFSFAGEHKNYSAGRKKLILDYKGWRICPLICFDLRFPVWARNLENYDLLFYVANWPAARVSSWDTLLKARSIENVCYTAGLNRIGKDPNVEAYNGHSAVYKPMGKRISNPDWEKEFIETVTLKKSELSEMRRRFPFLDDKDNFHIEL